MIRISKQAARLRNLLGVALAFALAACVSGAGGSGSSTSGGGSDSIGAPLGFAPGQVTEVLASNGPTPPPGQCRQVQQTAWVTDVQSIQLVANTSLGPDSERLACEQAMQRIQSQGEQRCDVSYSNPGLYRNPQFLPTGLTASACRCNVIGDSTDCEISISAQCGYETVQTLTAQICG